MQQHLNRETKQGDPLNTILFNSLPEHITKQPSEKWNRANRRVRLAGILLNSGSLKHTTTMLDDLTKATTVHGLQQHSTKTKIISHTTLKARNNNAVAIQGMHIEILPPEGKIKYLGQLITVKNAVQVEFDSRIKCAWATSMSHRQELTSPRYLPTETQTEILRRIGGTISLLRFRDMDGDRADERETVENTTTDDDHAQMIIRTESTSTKCSAAAHAANVDEVADDKPHDSDREQEQDMTETSPQKPDEKEENSQDADSTSSFDNEPQEDLEDELEPRVKCTVRATHKSRRLVESKCSRASVL